MTFAPGRGEPLGQAAHAAVVDENRRGHGALRVGFGGIEPANRLRNFAQLALVDSGNGQNGARDRSNFVEPFAEAVEEQKELEVAASGRMNPPGNRGDAFHIIDPGNAVEVLIERLEEGEQPCTQFAVHGGGVYKLSAPRSVHSGMRTRFLVLAVALVTVSAHADIFGCGHTARRHASAALTGVSHITVIGRAGSLKVSGRSGAREVVATGTACADSASALNDIQFNVQQSGSELTIEAVIPDRVSWFGGSSGSLDMEVTVPDAMAIDITDGSGGTIVENVGPLTMVDGSGELTIRGVHGDANVHDGSGALTIADVAGSLRVVDGSGEMDIDGVGGNVTITDGSGGITVRNVQRNVTVEDDGSGSVDVRDVHGDFTVGSKGSGSIDYERVAGRVSIPRRNR